MGFITVSLTVIPILKAVVNQKTTAFFFGTLLNGLFLNHWKGGDIMKFKKRKEYGNDDYFERMKQENLEKSALNGIDLFRPF